LAKLNNNELKGNEYKTAKAFFELADINTNDIVKATSFEDFIAELEATQFIILEELFKYWQYLRKWMLMMLVLFRLRSTTKYGYILIQRMGNYELKITN